MNTDPNRLLKTIPGTNTELEQEKYNFDSDRWVNTLPKKNVNKRFKL